MLTYFIQAATTHHRSPAIDLCKPAFMWNCNVILSGMRCQGVLYVLNFVIHRLVQSELAFIYKPLGPYQVLPGFHHYLLSFACVLYVDLPSFVISYWILLVVTGLLGVVLMIFGL